KIIKEKINILKDDYKTIIYLIDFQEFSYKDAAKIMGKSLIQTKVLIYRARQKLKGLLKEEG
ncbi:MAG: sigma factor-like helix-turn-helix DNA-binding protein, partial [Clostridium sp.]|nr:sigma factor-like helix-turn-helix DNA-binding protein [Clostridium sp.]